MFRSLHNEHAHIRKWPGKTLSGFISSLSEMHYSKNKAISASLHVLPKLTRHVHSANIQRKHAHTSAMRHLGRHDSILDFYEGRKLTPYFCPLRKYIAQYSHKTRYTIAVHVCAFYLTMGSIIWASWKPWKVLQKCWIGDVYWVGSITAVFRRQNFHLK